MKVIETRLDGVLIIEPDVYADGRGYFFETWNTKRYSERIEGCFVQDNVSFSSRGVLRGLHYQNPSGQGKLAGVLAGRVVDVAVDIRYGSPTFGKYVMEELSDRNHRQLYIPPGYAHGFCVLSETAIFSYKCTDYYNPKSEGGIIWNDPQIGIDWPVKEPVLSGKDSRYPLLGRIPQEKLPRYGGGR